MKNSTRFYDAAAACAHCNMLALPENSLNVERPVVGGVFVVVERLF